MKHRTGFTLIELMVTIAVGSILVALAVPNFRTMIAANRTTALANEMVTALNLARSEAIKRGSAVIICPSLGGSSCKPPSGGAPPSCDASNWADHWAEYWADGWMVFVDVNQTGTWDSGDELLRVWGAIKGDPLIKACDDSDDNVTTVQFQNLGAPVAATTIEIQLEGCQGNQSRQINLGASGRISMVRQECST